MDLDHIDLPELEDDWTLTDDNIPNSDISSKLGIISEVSLKLYPLY
jgi:hypothetical protein